MKSGSNKLEKKRDLGKGKGEHQPGESREDKSHRRERRRENKRKVGQRVWKGHGKSGKIEVGSGKSQGR